MWCTGSVFATGAPQAITAVRCCIRARPVTHHSTPAPLPPRPHANPPCTAPPQEISRKLAPGQEALEAARRELKNAIDTVFGAY